MIRRCLQRVLSFFRSGRAEAQLAREIDAHLRLLEDTFLARGMSPDEARSAARRAFGGVEQAKEHQRDARSFRWVDHSWLDLKLGARMLIKYPGLTLVGGLGITVAIAIGAAAGGIIHTLLDPALPLDEGERVVALENWDRIASKAERRILPDFIAWREELKSVRDIAAFREVERNLIAPGGQPEAVRVAEMTASGFAVARVPAIVGRHLLDDDEHRGAPAALVIGEDVWRTRFGGDPAIVGRAVQLNDTTYSIVGVMPQGFEFPVSHRFWVPLRADATNVNRGTGPEVFAFGRLAPGATRESAQAELTIIGGRAAATFPSTHRQLVPRVLPYTYPFSDMDDPENVGGLRLMQVLITLLLVLIAANVSILVYARTAMRHGEIAVRSALGASRRRIVGQLFAEALVLSLAAAALGLACAAIAFRQLDAALLQFGWQLPFWLNFGLSSSAVGYALALAVLAAAIVGIVPALKATGYRVQARLRTLSLGGGSGMQLGGTWTVLIVAQVAVAVAILPPAVFHVWDKARVGIADPGATAKEFLTAQLEIDGTASRYGERHAEIMRRLQAESGFAGVTFALAVPGQEVPVWIEVEGVAMPAESVAETSDYAVQAGRFGHEVRFNRVDVDFFDAFDVPVLMGRTFDTADAHAQAGAVIVSRSFAQRIVGATNVLGRRIRYVGRSGGARPEHMELGRWYEIVGVVSDFPSNATGVGLVDAKVYHATAPGQVQPVTLAVRVRGSAQATVAGRLREIAAAIDPNVQLRDVVMLDEALRSEQGLARLVAAVLAFVTLSVVLLSAAGIYAMMSFTVTQRRREIGIRAALGADPRRILTGVFSRALGQLATGAVLGIAAALLFEQAAGGDLMQGHSALVLAIVVVLMTVVGLLAALGPARRGLRIDPTEALRAGQ